MYSFVMVMECKYLWVWQCSINVGRKLREWKKIMIVVDGIKHSHTHTHYIYIEKNIFEKIEKITNSLTKIKIK